jgi:hypothetical protein
MNEDQDRNRMDNSPYNLAILRHMALNVMQKEGSKGHCAESSNGPHGMTTISGAYWPVFEMRLPWW